MVVGGRSSRWVPPRAGFVEFTPLEAGHYSFVNHGASLAEKGQVGVFEVTD